MSLRGKSSSFVLAALAFVSWLCSLALPAFSDYSGEMLWGLNILLVGWLGPLNLTFAWFANFFFLVAVARLLCGGTTCYNPVVAFIISLDTLRFTSYPRNEGGAMSIIYGYGPGALLWFLSIALLMIAAGLRLKEQARGDKTAGRKLRFTGCAMCLVLLAATAALSVRDRIKANMAERKKLESVLFKRVAVCEAPEPDVASQVSMPDGPLEVRVARRSSQANYPFAQVKDYLKWGVRTVRFDDRDYSTYDAGGETLLVSEPATAPATALLEVAQDQQGTIVARLSDLYLDRVIFEQSWAMEPIASRNYFCPDYHSFPAADQQPRKLLVQALGLPQESRLPDDLFYSRLPYEKVEGKVSKLAEKRGSAEERVKAWEQAHPDQWTFPYSVKVNYNCPDNVGWKSATQIPLRNIGNPFAIGDRFYHLGKEGSRAYCDGDAVYIYQVYSGFGRNNQFTLNITKRTLPDLNHLWTRLVKFKSPIVSRRDNEYEIQGFREIRGGADAILVHDRTGKVLKLSFPVMVEKMGK